MSNISSILNIAKSALSATQMSLQTTSHNIANVNTDGYSRQEVVLDEAPPMPTTIGLMGDGVRATTVMRYYDKYLEDAIAKKNTDLEGEQVSSKYFQRIEGTLNEDNSHLSQNITDFFNSWHDLSTDPQSVSARTAIVGKGQALARSIRNIYSDLKGVQLELNNDVKSQVNDINRLTKSIASLNEMVAEGSTQGSQANDYLDKRTAALKDLSGKLDLVSFEDKNGGLTVLTSKGQVLVDGNNSWELAATDDPATGLSRVAWKDSSGHLYDITDGIQAGSLKATLDMRDTQIPGFIGNMDELARVLIEQVNGAQAGGYDLYGTNNNLFFNNLTGNYAENIDVSDAVKADPKHIAATSSATNTTDNDVALSIAGLANSNLFDGGTSTIIDYTSSMVDRIGELAKASNDAVTYEQDQMSALQQQRASVSGVSLDEEMANLIKFQQAYQASSRLYTVADTLMQALLDAVK